MNELALFAGAGGGILGGQLLGWRTVCAVERDAYAAAVLAQRQNDGLLDLFPVWSDITTFDGRTWRGIVDVVSGGFPCQDISVAGKGAGIDGERSGLWGEMERIISEVRPRFVFVENSPALTLRGLGRVLGDLASLGYDAEWGVLGASDVGAPHKRERIWILAHTSSTRTGSISGEIDSDRRRLSGGNESPFRQTHGPDGANRIVATSKIEGDVADSESVFDGSSDTRKGKGQVQQSGICDGAPALANTDSKKSPKSGPSWSGRAESCDERISGERIYSHDWAIEPDVGRVAHGVEFRVDRLKAIGNGQVPECAAEAWRRLMKRIESNEA